MQNQWRNYDSQNLRLEISMLLANLLRSFSEEEIAKVRADFQLAERSRLLFERIAASADTPPDSENLAKALRISTENLYCLNSEIVDECVRILAPNEEFATMNFFQSKYLYRPFVTEAHRTEKLLLREHDRKRLEKFYEYVFVHIFQFPADLIDLDLAEEFGYKWHHIRENPPADDELYIRLRVIAYRIGALSKKKKMTIAQMSISARSFLDPITEHAASSTNPLVRHEYFQAEWKSSVYANLDPKMQIEWLRRSLYIIREHPSLFAPELEESVELQIAYELAMNCDRAPEGLGIFKKFYHGQTPTTPSGALYLVRFCRVAFLARDFETTAKMVAEFITYQDALTTPTIYVSALLTKTMLEIVKNAAEAASETIEIAKASNHAHFSLANEVVIRGLETAIALKKNDFAVAEQLVERNSKWLRSRRLLLPTTSWIYFYQIIGEIINYRMMREPIRASILEHFTNDFRNEYPEFYFLLEQEIREVTAA